MSSLQNNPRAAIDPQTMPMISVIIPSYNHGHFLSEAIDSVVAQTYPHHEIIVVDDGSIDRTADVVSLYPGVRFLRQRNRGPAAARNRGIQESRGEYVVFLDADDRLLPRHFEISLDAFRSHPEVGWVCGDFRFFGGTPVWEEGHHCAMPDAFASLLHFCCIGAIHAVMYCRHAVLKSGGFNERLKACEDWEFHLRLSRQARLYCHHQRVAEYRMTDQQRSRLWHVMFRWYFYVLRTQWPFVRGHRLYEEAYRKGIAQSRATYGERALWQMVADGRSGRLTEAFQAFWVLLRCYPAGLVDLFKGKASKSFFFWKQRSS